MYSRFIEASVGQLALPIAGRGGKEAMRLRMIALAGMCVILYWAAAATAAGPRVILALGSSSFIDPRAVMRTIGAEITQDPDKIPLKDVAVLVLANVPFGSLPGPIQQDLVEYVNSGGAVLITGGVRSFGSGGYKTVASIIPFEIRSDSDWRASPFRPPIMIRPDHPILAGVDFITIGSVNDMNPRPGASEILRSPGGGGAGPFGARGGFGVGGTYPYSLIAELSVGAGRVIGIAFDMDDMAGMRDRDRFVENTLYYLLASSRKG
jgi:hypothetical protein